MSNDDAEMVNGSTGQGELEDGGGVKLESATERDGDQEMAGAT